MQFQNSDDRWQEERQGPAGLHCSINIQLHKVSGVTGGNHNTPPPATQPSTSTVYSNGDRAALSSSFAVSLSSLFLSLSLCWCVGLEVYTHAPWAGAEPWHLMNCGTRGEDLPIFFFWQWINLNQKVDSSLTLLPALNPTCQTDPNFLLKLYPCLLKLNWVNIL
jgi:hypothetical protein